LVANSAQRAMICSRFFNMLPRRYAFSASSPGTWARQYYNSETKTFAIEDPALFYFIKHLDWNQLRQDCGFREQSPDFEYEVAISFAGENRELARFISESLTALDVSNFFDEMFEATFWEEHGLNSSKRYFPRKASSF